MRNLINFVALKEGAFYNGMTHKIETCFKK